MKYEKDKEETFNFRIDSKLKNEYQKFCKERGYSISKRIRILIENDVKNGK